MIYGCYYEIYAYCRDIYAKLVDFKLLVFRFYFYKKL